MSVVSDLLVVYPYDFDVTSTGFPGIKSSRVVAYTEIKDLRGSDFGEDFVRCFSKETPFAIYWEDFRNDVQYIETGEVGCEAMMDVIEDKFGHRLKFAPNKEELLIRAKALAEHDDDWHMKALVSLIESYKDYSHLEFVLYQH